MNHRADMTAISQWEAGLQYALHYMSPLIPVDYDQWDKAICT